MRRKKILEAEFKSLAGVDSVQRKLRVGQLVGHAFVIGLHLGEVIIEISVVDDIGNPCADLRYARFRQIGLHFGELGFSSGQLRDVNEHFVDGHVEAGDDMCGVEYIVGVLELADFAFKFFLTFLRVGIAVFGPH